jgi:ATP-dependent DNA ligase
MVEIFASLSPDAFVLDGELAIPSGGGFSFDQLLQRVHPAASRVRKLAVETPAVFIAFDLLADEKGKSWVERPLAERRAELERFAAKHFAGQESLLLSPATARLKDATKWLERVGETLDGIIAKRRDLPYLVDQRDGMVKIKNYRSADCVVGGFRYGTNSKVVGSLLLGLYNSEGKLDHVGYTSNIPRGVRAELTKKLEALIEPPGFTGAAPGGPSRWNKGKENPWKPLRPELVVEVSYDHFSGGRFRHGTNLLRWRPDKAPTQCTWDQVEQKGADLRKLLKAA